MDAPSAHTQRATGLFETTRWSVVRAAAAGGDERAKAAMTWLFKNYWHPLYTFIRGMGQSREDAEDVVQEFFARLMDGRLLNSVTPERGRFRTMMLTSLRNLELDIRRGGQAQKRGGGAEHVPFDFEDAEAAWLRVADDALTPEAAFDRAWAQSLVELAGRRLREECEAAGKGGLFTELFPFVTGGEGVGDFSAAAARLDMNEKAARMALSRLRRSYTAAIRAEVAETVGSHDDEKDELRYLLENFS